MQKTLATAFITSVYSLIISSLLLPFQLIYLAFKKVGNGSTRLFGLHKFGELSVSDTAILAKVSATARGLFEQREKKDPVTAALLRGDYRAAAEMQLDPKKYPLAYKEIPKDFRRSPVRDGRLYGSAPAPTLAACNLTDEFVVQSYKSAYKRAIGSGIGSLIIFSVVAILIWVAAITGSLFVSHAASGSGFEPVQQTTLPFLDPAAVAQNYRDVWSAADVSSIVDASKFTDRSGSFGAKTKQVVQLLITSVLLAVVLFVTVVSLSIQQARMEFAGAFTGAVFTALDRSVSHLRGIYREAMQLWRFRLADRKLVDKAYEDQIHMLTEVDVGPRIVIGQAEGLLAFRKHLLAPEPGQAMSFSIPDLTQHVAVYGGSGEGKSRNLYIPVVRQLLQLRKDGYPVNVFATDDKAVIWQDVVRVAAEVGLPADDVLVVGTGPDQYRVDLLDGLEPVEVAEILGSVAKQTGGEAGSDSFWPQMANDLLLQVAQCLYVAEQLPAGIQWMEKNGIRMYSLLNILSVSSDDTRIEEVLEWLAEAMTEGSENYCYIAEYDNNALKAAMGFLAVNWLSMVDATKDGIKANARNALRGFAFHEKFASGYADGAGERLLTHEDLTSNKVVCIALSQVDGGMSAKTIAVMLKSILYKRKLQEQARDPQAAADRLKYWFAPYPTEDKKKVFCVFVADEYQAIITASNGNDGGLSCSSFWNVARSAGVGAIVLTQSPAAYRMAIGDKAFNNIELNWRSSVFLRTEDTSTIEKGAKLGGKTMRYLATDGHLHEGLSAALLESGNGLLNEVKWDPELDVTASLPSEQLACDHFEFATWDSPYEFDGRFILEKVDDKQDAMAQLSAKQAAAWRQEDRIAASFGAGQLERDAIEAQDIMSMGRGRALCMVQNAGMTRIDIVKLAD